MEENPPQPSGDRANDPNALPPAGPDAPEVKPAPAKRRRRRRWPYVVGGLVVLLLAVVLLAPSIASTGPVRNAVLGVVNDSLNGKVEVADWSIGWTSGITVDGLKVRDQANQVVLQASRVRTELSLWKTIKSGGTEIALGRTDVDNLDLTRFHIEEDGTPNYAKLAKPSQKETKPSEKPIRLSGDLHVNHLTGTVTAAGVAQRLRINPSDIAVVITDLNDPIKNDVKLAFTVEDPSNPAAAAPPGSIAIVGDADVMNNDKVDLDTAKVKQRLTIAGVNLAAANPFLAMAKQKLELGGITNGALDVDVAGKASGGAVGEIKVANFRATGEALQGDVFQSDLTIPIKATLSAEKADLTVVKVDDLKIQTNYGYVAVTGNASRESLERLQQGAAPGRDGHLTLTVHFDKAAQLIGSMPRTLKLLEGVKVDSASLFAQVEAWLQADKVVTKTQFNLENVAGTRTVTDAGKTRTDQIRLAPVTTTLDVTYLPAGAQPFTIGQLRDLALVLNSGFAQVTGESDKGATLAQFHLKGNGDLAKLQQQLAQFVQLGELKLQGTWTLNADTDGDPTKPDAVVKTNAKFTLNNAQIAGLGTLPPIKQPWLDLTAGGDVKLDQSAPRWIENAMLALQSNNAQRPTVDLLARAGKVDLKTLACTYDLQKLNVDVAKAREEFGPMVPVLDYFAGGRLTASGAGSYDGKAIVLSEEKPLTVKATALTVRRPATQQSPAKDVMKDQSLDVNLAGRINLAGDVLGAQVTSLALVAPQLLEVRKTQGAFDVSIDQKSKKLVSGNGGLTLFADLKRLSDISRSFAPPAPPPAPAPAPGAPAQPESSVGELTQGKLNGTLTFARGNDPVTTIGGNLTADVAVTTNKEPLTDKIVVTLSGSAPDDLTKEIVASLSVKGNLLNADVKDARVALLSPGGSGEVNGVFDLVRTAQLVLNVPRLDAMQAMLNSFSGGAAAQPAVASAPQAKVTGDQRISGAPEVDTEADADQPLPPMQITGGALALTANVSREGQVTLLKDTKLDVTGLKFRRGDGYYESGGRKISLNLGAAIETTPPAQAASLATTAPSVISSIRKIELRQLEGDLDVARLTMPKTIVVTDLAAAVPSVAGAVDLRGQLAEAFRFVEAFQGAKAGSKYPYGGAFALAQEFVTRGQTVQVIGSLKAEQFRAFDPQDPRKVVFAEELLTLTNDLSADTKTDSATIKDLSLNMESTKTLAVSITNGRLTDWADQRKIADKLQIKLRVDWPKLYALAKPMLDPDTQASLDENKLELAGVMDRTFTVTGAFPATGFNKRGRKITLTTGQSLKFLTFDGGINIDRLFVAGLDVRSLELNVKAEKGIVTFNGKPFVCNDGSGDVDGLQVDLRHPSPTDPTAISPWITIPQKNKVLLSKVSLNAFLADSSIGKYINPGFSGAKDARGRLTVTSVECRDVPLDWFTASKRGDAPARSDRRERRMTRSNGRAEFLIAISEMQMQAPFLGFVLKTDEVSGHIAKGHVSIENGVVRSDIPIVDSKGNLQIGWSGSVNLQTRTINSFDTAIAKEFLADLPILRNNEKFLPAILHVPVSGSFDAPKVDLAAAVVKSALPGFGGGGKPEDLIPGILEQLGGGRKDKDKDKPKEAPRKGDDRRSSDDRRDAQPAGAARPDDPVGGLIDIAGGLLGGAKKDDSREMPDARKASDPRPPGDQRISEDPPRKNRDAGDQRISSEPAKPPATQPARRGRGR